MLISKFDLYKSEWLDLVFENRNKTYGAYELRQHYAGNMVKAMGITFLGVALLCGASLIFMKAPTFAHITEVNNTPIVLPPVQPAIKRVDPPKPKALKAEAPAKPAATIKDLPPVVTVDAQAVNPPKNADLTGKTISDVDVKGPANSGNVLPAETSGSGTGATPAPDETVYSTGGVDIMPEPVGGSGAWAKFLNKNLRFPAPAQEEGVSGRVFLSFIIEKDGSLSNIVVERGAGHGFDEEALRVLKLAKAWKPGMQNGQPVRVKYVIPINFQLAE